MTLRAHFDGKVIVPDEPLDLPVDSAVEIVVKCVPPEKDKSFKQRHGIPLARNDGVKMTSAEVTDILSEG